MRPRTLSENLDEKCKKRMIKVIATAFSSGNVDLTFGTPENGKVKFTAVPKDAETKTFFMKVRVKP